MSRGAMGPCPKLGPRKAGFWQNGAQNWVKKEVKKEAKKETKKTAAFWPEPKKSWRREEKKCRKKRDPDLKAHPNKNPNNRNIFNKVLGVHLEPY